MATVFRSCSIMRMLNPPPPVFPIFSLLVPPSPNFRNHLIFAASSRELGCLPARVRGSGFPIVDRLPQALSRLQ